MSTEVEYPSLCAAMKQNPRIVIRTWSVMLDGRMVFLTLISNSCRLYIHHRIRIRNSDEFMYSMEKQDAGRLLAALQEAEEENTRLWHGCDEDIQTSISTAMAKADIGYESRIACVRSKIRDTNM